MTRNGDANHAPTPQRLQRARSEGTLCRSQGLIWSGIWITFVSAIAWWGPLVIARWQAFTRETWTADSVLNRDGSYWPAVAGLLMNLFPFLLLIAAATLALNFMQGGFSFFPDRIVPRLSRLVPERQPFSLEHLIRGTTTLLKVVSLLSITVIFVIWKQHEILTLGNHAADATFDSVCRLLLTFCVQVAMVLGCYGLLDYGVARFEYMRGLRMTDREILDEQRQLDGDPRIHSARSLIYRDRAAPSLQINWSQVELLVVDGKTTVYAVGFKTSTEKSAHRDRGVLLWSVSGLQTIQIIGMAGARNLAIHRDAMLAMKLAELKPGCDIQWMEEIRR